MKKLRYIFTFAVIILLIIFTDMKASATSWVVLEPEKVVERADVIVSGTYDFSSEPELSNFVFQGLDFHVNKVYKGNVQEKVTAGIDGFDIGWAGEFQNQGGEFLLFLEDSEDANFLIPVAGPNGMVQLLDGKVEDQNEEKRSFFEDYLKSQEKQTTAKEPKKAEKPEKDNQDQNDKPNTLLYAASAGMLVILGVFILIYRNRRKR